MGGAICILDFKVSGREFVMCALSEHYLTDTHSKALPSTVESVSLQLSEQR